MPHVAPTLPVRADELAREPFLQLLNQVQHYLTAAENGQPAAADAEAAWNAFHKLCSRKIRSFAVTCGATAQDIADCIQEVWTELLVRLPKFRLDPKRGQFDTWLFHIVRGKTADQRRAHKRRLLQQNSDALPTLWDHHPSAARTVEEAELFALACAELRKRLSGCNYRILQMRLVENRPVAEVAQQLGLSQEQVWYRYHRARREAEQIGVNWSTGQSARKSIG
jgi:RNA polymerase sigma factor (sigma-70 family)